MSGIESEHPWDIEKGTLITGAVHAAEGIATKYATAQPGTRFIDVPLSEHVHFTATRSQADATDNNSFTILLNVFHDDVEAGQVELRYDRLRGEWLIPDRQINRVYQGKGIFSALLAAGERFFSDIAEKNTATLPVDATLGQRKVLEVFEHKGYDPIREHTAIADLVRNPGDHSDEVVEQYAWPPPHPTSKRQVLLDDRDPYVFRKSVLAMKERPTPWDALRVTLTKEFHPVQSRVGHEKDVFRDAVKGKLT